MKETNIHEHECVDMALPSGIKWATCNVGASSPEESGDCVAWGEIEPKSEYTIDNYHAESGAIGDIGGDEQHDVARIVRGGHWKMPTQADYQELVDNCAWTWTTLRGVKGYKVVSPKNGNSIFLPAVGWRIGSVWYSRGESGCYWSATREECDVDKCCYLYFDEENYFVSWHVGHVGRPVRPVWVDEK